MQKNDFKFKARIKEVKVRTLVSGDKEAVLDLRVNGDRDILIASQLANLPIEDEVEIHFQA